MHQARFNIETRESLSYKLKQRLWGQNDIFIEDIAHSKKTRPRKRGSAQKGGSKIYVEPMTTFQMIFPVLTSYMKEYYAMKKDTLTMEICRA